MISYISEQKVSHVSLKSFFFTKKKAVNDNYTDLNVINPPQNFNRKSFLRKRHCFFAIFIAYEENFKHNYKGTFFLERKLLSVVDEILCIATLRMQRISVGFEKTFYPFKNCCK